MGEILVPVGEWRIPGRVPGHAQHRASAACERRPGPRDAAALPAGPGAQETRVLADERAGTDSYSLPCNCRTSGGSMNYRSPGSTYRLQFHAGFRFVDGRDLVPYLSDLGITDLYSSPRYKARRGSSHGYDIANPLRVNSELGTEEDFDEMAVKLQHYGMGLLLDTVPNHMAASYENPWWMDVLENGQSSVYAGYFDIDWHPPTAKAEFLQDNRVLLPILGDLYGDVLRKGELALKIEDTGIH